MFFLDETTPRTTYLPSPTTWPLLISSDLLMFVDWDVPQRDFYLIFSFNCLGRILKEDNVSFFFCNSDQKDQWIFLLNKNSIIFPLSEGEREIFYFIPKLDNQRARLAGVLRPIYHQLQKSSYICRKLQSTDIRASQPFSTQR